MGLPTEPWLSWIYSNYEVTVVNESNNNNNNKSSHDNNDGMELCMTAACSLIKLLDTRLSCKTFYFISSITESVQNDKSSSSFVSVTDTNCSSPKDSSFPAIEEIANVSSSGSSMLGSPLKLEKIADLSALPTSRKLSHKEKSIIGLDLSQQVTLQDARQILRKFNKVESEVNMLTVLCNGEDLMVGAHKEIAQDRLNMTTFVLSKKIVRLSSLEESHQVKSSDKSSQMRAEYELLDPSLGLGSITLTAKWSDAKGRLKITEPLSTEFSLEWITETENEQSPVSNLYRELQKVSKFIDALKGDKLAETVFDTEAEPGEDALKRLKDLFSMKKLNFHPEEDWSQDCDGSLRSVSGLAGGIASASMGANRLNLNPAVESDFTDELWDVVGSSCSSVLDMVSCVREIFSEMGRGQIHMPVSSENHSMLASLARAAASRLAVFPPLTGPLALRLLAEAGVERLRKLYHAIMVIENKLCSPAQWDETFTQPEKQAIAVAGDTDTELATLSAQIHALGKLHRCLESVAIIDAFTDTQDLPKVTSVVLNNIKREADSTSGHSGSYKMAVSPALALPELKKHQWALMRRERVASGVFIVETFLHNMPKGLLEKAVCESGSVLCFTARHNTLVL